LINTGFRFSCGAERMFIIDIRFKQPGCVVVQNAYIILAVKALVPHPLSDNESLEHELFKIFKLIELIVPAIAIAGKPVDLLSLLPACPPSL